MLLLVSNLGLAFNVHYCKGQISAITSVFNDSDRCEMPAPEPEVDACCAKAKLDHKPCCKDKLVDLNESTDPVVIKTFAFEITAPFIAPQFYNPVFAVATEAVKSQVIEYECLANAPPLFKLYQQFIFYA